MYESYTYGLPLNLAIVTRMSGSPPAPNTNQLQAPSSSNASRRWKRFNV